MGFRDPITSATDLDTVTTRGGVRIYNDVFNGFQRGVVQFYDPKGSAFLTASPLLNQDGSVELGSQTRFQGIGTNGVTAPAIALDVEEAGTGGYRSAFRASADVVQFSGIVTHSGTTFGDTGDVAIAGLTANGWAPTSGAFYRLKNGVCSISFAALRSAGWASGQQIAPAGSVPSPTVVHWPAGNVSGSTLFNVVRVATDGSLTVFGAATGSNDLRFDIAYAV